MYPRCVSQYLLVGTLVFATACSESKNQNPNSRADSAPQQQRQIGSVGDTNVEAALITLKNPDPSDPDYGTFEYPSNKNPNKEYEISVSGSYLEDDGEGGETSVDDNVNDFCPISLLTWKVDPQSAFDRVNAPELGTPETADPLEEKSAIASINRELTIFSQISFEFHYITQIELEADYKNCVWSDVSALQEIEKAPLESLRVLVKLAFDGSELHSIPLQYDDETDQWKVSLEYKNGPIGLPLLLQPLTDDERYFIDPYSFVFVDREKTWENLQKYHEAPPHKTLIFDVVKEFQNDVSFSDIEEAKTAFLEEQAVGYNWETGAMAYTDPSSYEYVPEESITGRFWVARGLVMPKNCISIDLDLDFRDPRYLLTPNNEETNPYYTVSISFENDFFSGMYDRTDGDLDAVPLIYHQLKGFIRQFRSEEDVIIDPLYAHLSKKRLLRFNLDLNQFQMNHWSDPSPGCQFPNFEGIPRAPRTYARLHSGMAWLGKSGPVYRSYAWPYDSPGTNIKDSQVHIFGEVNHFDPDLSILPGEIVFTGVVSFMDTGLWAHELGHAIGSLDDEYDEFVDEEKKNLGEPDYPIISELLPKEREGVERFYNLESFAQMRNCGWRREALIDGGLWRDHFGEGKHWGCNRYKTSIDGGGLSHDTSAYSVVRTLDGSFSPKIRGEWSLVRPSNWSVMNSQNVSRHFNTISCGWMLKELKDKKINIASMTMSPDITGNEANENPQIKHARMELLYDACENWWFE